jgi:DNA-binding MurR/RpiR family transcriptional regulator
VNVADRITSALDRLTPAERKVAAVVADDAQAVAFGTVAEIATRAGTSGPSVVRLATRLGYSGFAELQADVQAELARQLPPATARIRQQAPTDVAGRARTVETTNLEQTLTALREADLRQAIELLADPKRTVWIVAGEAMRPAGLALADRLEQLRDNVRLVAGSNVRTRRQLAGLTRRDTVVAIDLRRYERWVVDTVDAVAQRRASIISITDGPMSPLAPRAEVVFTVAAAGVGPFDSLVGVVALVDVLIAGVAAALKKTATPRLDAIEASWGDALM